MVIDKNFPGIIERDGFFKIEGDLMTSEYLKILIPLFVTGSITAGRWIAAKRWIESGGSITAGVEIESVGSITAVESITAGKWIVAGGSITAVESITAGKWIVAGEGIKAGKWIKMDGITTKGLSFINGLSNFRVTILDTHIKVGCEIKSKSEWKTWLETATEADARELGDDGSAWAIRDLIAKFL